MYIEPSTRPSGRTRESFQLGGWILRTVGESIEVGAAQHQRACIPAVWTGKSKLHSTIGKWQRRLQTLFTLAGVEGGHAHRFRDTFAVELLLAGVPLERVSVLLGHQSVRITERHYAPWVRSRQEQLEADLQRTWERDPIAQMQTKCTPEVHGENRVIN
jgi:integrase